MTFTLFANLTSATGQELDTNFGSLANMAVVSGTVTGTNTLAFTANANWPTLSSYTANQLFAFVAAGTNTGATTFQYGTLPALSVYKDTAAGPVVLVGGEIVANTYNYLAYDATLNSNAGGFHLIPSPFVAAPILPASGTTSITVAAATVLSAAALTGNSTGQAIIARSGAVGAGFTDTLVAAASIVGAFPSAAPNSLFKVRIINSTGQSMTLTPGAGTTFAGTSVVSAASSHDFWGVVTQVSPASVAMYG